MKSIEGGKNNKGARDTKNKVNESISGVYDAGKYQELVMTQYKAK